MIVSVRTVVTDLCLHLRLTHLCASQVDYFSSVARLNKCTSSCTFYRSEAKPKPGAIDNFGGPGPPYALVQGRMPFPGRAGSLPKEHSPILRRGMVAVIQGGPDFFIAVGDHPEWGNAHVVWGVVEDMSVVDAITRMPVREQVWGQTHVTELITPIPFTPKLISLSDE